MGSELLSTAAELKCIDRQSITATIESLLKSGVIKAHKDGNHGSSYPRVDEFGSHGVPFLTAKLLCDGKIDIDGAPRLADDKADKLRLGFVQPGDVLLSHNATIGRVAIVPPFSGRLLIGTSLTYFRLDESKLLPRYLAAYFSGSDFQNQLKAVMSQTTRNQVPITAQRFLRVVIPPMSIQKSIAAILGALDDRIAVLRETNATLEAIAQALFKSWFVDFDPVRAKSEGREPEGLDAETAGLFPDGFEQSEFGLLPKGWQVGPILSIASLLSGGTPKTDRTDYWGGNIAWASAKDVSQSRSSALVRTERAITLKGLGESATRLIPALATVVVARGATTGRMVFFGREMAMNQTCYALTSKTGTPVALYCHMKQQIDKLVNAAHGSVFDTITTNTFSQSKTVLPPKPLLEYYERIVDPIFQKIVVATEAIDTLSSLRDALLPRLISGQLRLSEAKALLQNAA